VFPSFFSVFLSLVKGLGIGGEPELWKYTWHTLTLILEAYGISTVFSIFLTAFAYRNVWGREVLTVLTGTFQPLPSIALLPMAILWFGFTDRSLIFVVVMSMVWPLTTALTVGFNTVSPTLFRLGENYELGPIGFLRSILLPAALPSLIAGLRVSWGFGWRTVVAAELVFGATGNQGGIGWYINNAQMFLETSKGMAAILVVVLIGLITEGIFRLLQRATTYRWGLEKP